MPILGAVELILGLTAILTLVVIALRIASSREVRQVEQERQAALNDIDVARRKKEVDDLRKAYSPQTDPNKEPKL